jgi:hypothetical protein
MQKSDIGDDWCASIRAGKRLWLQLGAISTKPLVPIETVLCNILVDYNYW